MKGLVKWIALTALITAAIIILTNRSRQRATAPETAWQPPTVTPPPAEEAPAAPDDAQAEAETLREMAAEAEALSIAAEQIAAAEEELAAEEAFFEEVALAVADDEGMGDPEAAPEDIALDETGETVISELAAPGVAEAIEAEAFRHHHPEAAPPVEVVHAPDVPDFGAMLEEAVHEAELSEPAAETPVEEEPKDPDFLTRYFEELAATPETHEPSPETPAPAVDDLPASVEEALTDLEPAPIVPPPKRTAESFLDEGNVYFNVGQYGLAVERYTQAIEMDGDLTAAFYNRANAHTRSGDFERALADYNRALELQPRDADALNNRGMLHLYRSNYPAALADFNGALEADPTDTTVMVNRGLAHLHGGDAASALVDFREAAAKDESDAAAQYGAAQAAASLGNRDEALRHITRALELDPAYAREAAGDPRLELLQGDEEFLKLLRESGPRTS